jgi:hypothetical protein
MTDDTTPGKFEGCADQTLAEELYQLTLDGSCETDGRTEAPTGFFAIIEDYGDPAKSYILVEDDRGFVTVQQFDHAHEAHELYASLREQYEVWDADVEDESGPLGYKRVTLDVPIESSLVDPGEWDWQVLLDTHHEVRVVSVSDAPKDPDDRENEGFGHEHHGPSYGQSDGCQHCGQDIQYVGIDGAGPSNKGLGWFDRGGNFHCQDGSHTPHRP